MVDEVTDGVSGGGIFHRVHGGAQALKDQLQGKKITIATMPHESLDTDDGGLFAKNLVYVIRLRGEDEAFASFHEGAGHVDRDYDLAAAKERRKREAIADKKGKGLLAIRSKRKIKKEMKKDLAEFEEDEIDFASDYAPVHVDAFVVRENERALFIQAGQSLGVVEPGMWTIDENFSQTGTEIIYVDISQFQFNWGFGGILTKEHAKVASHGTATIKVRDPRNFIINIVSSKKEAGQKEIEEFVHSKLKSAIKGTIGKYGVADLVHEEDKVFSARIRSKVHEMLESWGLDIVDITVLGFKLPPEFEKLFKEQSQSAVEDVRVGLDAKAANRSVNRLNQQQQIDLAAAQKDANVDIAKMQLETQKKQQEMQLQMMKEKLALQQQQHQAELAKIQRKINAEDKLADIDVNEIAGMSTAKVKRAGIDAESSLRDHDLNLSRNRYDRDVRVAQTTGKGETKINDTTVSGIKPGSGLGSSNMNTNESKMAGLKKRKKKLTAKLDKLDDLLMAEKIKESIYERRSNHIMNELEDIRREILSLKRMP